MSKSLSRSEQKRADIINAARQVFEQGGFQNTSMDKLAALAQVSKRTIYNHFESKEALVIQLLKELWHHTTQESEIRYQPQLALAPQLLALVKEEVDLVCSGEYIELMRIAFGHYFYKPEELQKEVAKLSAQESSLAKWLKAAIADGQLIETDVELAITQLHSLIKGSGLWPQLFKIKSPLNEQEQLTLAEQTVALFLSHYQA